MALIFSTRDCLLARDSVQKSSLNIPGMYPNLSGCAGRCCAVVVVRVGVPVWSSSFLSRHRCWWWSLLWWLDPLWCGGYCVVFGWCWWWWSSSLSEYWVWRPSVVAHGEGVVTMSSLAGTGGDGSVVVGCRTGGDGISVAAYYHCLFADGSVVASVWRSGPRTTKGPRTGPGPDHLRTGLQSWSYPILKSISPGPLLFWGA